MVVVRALTTVCKHSECPTRFCLFRSSFCFKLASLSITISKLYFSFQTTSLVIHLVTSIENTFENTESFNFSRRSTGLRSSSIDTLLRLFFRFSTSDNKVQNVHFSLKTWRYDSFLPIPEIRKPQLWLWNFFRFALPISAIGY